MSSPVQLLRLPVVPSAPEARALPALLPPQLSKRVPIELRQAIRDYVPRALAFYKDVAIRADLCVLVKGSGPKLKAP